MNVAITQINVGAVFNKLCLPNTFLCGWLFWKLDTHVLVESLTERHL